MTEHKQQGKQNHTSEIHTNKC